MFDYAQSEIRPWKVPISWERGRTLLLRRVEWKTAEYLACDLDIEFDKPEEHWRFHAIEPMNVVIQDDEGAVCALWKRRDECCKDAGGFLIVEASPIIEAIARYEGHVAHIAEQMQHFVVGTDAAVAHIICSDPPSPTRMNTP